MCDPGWATYRDLPTDDDFEYGTRYLVSEFFGSENASISVVEFTPDEAGPLQVHTAPVEEYYLVLTGELEVQLDETTVNAGAGTVLFIPPGTPHRPANTSPDPATLFSFMTPNIDIAEHTEYLVE